MELGTFFEGALFGVALYWIVDSVIVTIKARKREQEPREDRRSRL